MGIIPILKVPVNECFSSSTASFKRLALCNTRQACSITSFPGAVVAIGCFFLSNILTPNSSSSFCIIELKVGCVTLQCSAAFAKCLKR